LRLEWVFRLAIEPRRLWRRYVVGNPLFLWRVLRQKLFGKAEIVEAKR
jgi:UDP-N-acetyl-D-mannosaminuronic acid transferase (WecB/TagA/CpsF family)